MTSKYIPLVALLGFLIVPVFTSDKPHLGWVVVAALAYTSFLFFLALYKEYQDRKGRTNG